MDAADVAVVMGCVKQTLYKYFPDEIRHARVVVRAEAIELAWREARDGSSRPCPIREKHSCLRARFPLR
jgi:hypothetical protein